MEESLDIYVKKTMEYAEGSERARYLCDTGRWFARFCNRGMDQDYQGLTTLSENSPYFQVLPEVCTRPNLTGCTVKPLSYALMNMPGILSWITSC